MRRLLITLMAVLAGVTQLAAAQKTEIRYADLERIADIDTIVMVPMRDGVRLATDIFRPRGQDSALPLIFIKTPYDFNSLSGATLDWTFEAVKRGYAVAVQNERGRYYSEGDWEILGNPRTDGYDASPGGSYDQRGIEARVDVLVYSTPPLPADLEVTGAMRPTLFVSSDAPDTDFTVKLVDETEGVTAHNAVHHGASYPSRIELSVAPDSQPAANALDLQLQALLDLLPGRYRATLPGPGDSGDERTLFHTIEEIELPDYGERVLLHTLSLTAFDDPTPFQQKFYAFDLREGRSRNRMRSVVLMRAPRWQPGETPDEERLMRFPPECAITWRRDGEEFIARVKHGVCEYHSAAFGGPILPDMTYILTAGSFAMRDLLYRRDGTAVIPESDFVVATRVTTP